MSIYFEDPYYFASLITGIVLLTQVAAVITVVLLPFQSVATNPWLRTLATRSTLLAFVVALVSVASSLTFSDYFAMNPCKLCWFQRIFIFPQLVILAVALWKKHHQEITTYSIALACFAIPISIFHYALQMTDAPAVHAFAPCDVTGQAPSCSGFYVHMFGYITIPLMALTTSLLILILMLLRRKLNN